MTMSSCSGPSTRPPGRRWRGGAVQVSATEPTPGVAVSPVTPSVGEIGAKLDRARAGVPADDAGVPGGECLHTEAELVAGHVYSAGSVKIWKTVELVLASAPAGGAGEVTVGVRPFRPELILVPGARVGGVVLPVEPVPDVGTLIRPGHLDAAIQQLVDRDVVAVDEHGSWTGRSCSRCEVAPKDSGNCAVRRGHGVRVVGPGRAGGRGLPPARDAFSRAAPRAATCGLKLTVWRPGDLDRPGRLAPGRSRFERAGARCGPARTWESAADAPFSSVDEVAGRHVDEPGAVGIGVIVEERDAAVVHVGVVDW